ncbi:hypothetical protein AVEN_263115-1 [Araneus ventricosus]|uniref:Uncharacterized protein n=1 Tax=Araneus ventricosus TaxID=182803 RepID=A0A4Y2JF37_ARAVE|nr:hypothetical protein AVEN_263115-1 [Araneus ventricosus]
MNEIEKNKAASKKHANSLWRDLTINHYAKKRNSSRNSKGEGPRLHKHLLPDPEEPHSEYSKLPPRIRMLFSWAIQGCLRGCLEYMEACAWGGAAVNQGLIRGMANVLGMFCSCG